jgi:hypothetical protein
MIFFSLYKGVEGFYKDYCDFWLKTENFGNQKTFKWLFL